MTAALRLLYTAGVCAAASYAAMHQPWLAHVAGTPPEQVMFLDERPLWMAPDAPAIFSYRTASGRTESRRLEPATRVAVTPDWKSSAVRLALGLWPLSVCVGWLYFLHDGPRGDPVLHFAAVSGVTLSAAAVAGFGYLPVLLASTGGPPTNPSGAIAAAGLLAGVALTPLTYRRCQPRRVTGRPGRPG